MKRGKATSESINQRIYLIINAYVNVTCGREEGNLGDSDEEH